MQVIPSTGRQPLSVRLTKVDSVRDFAASCTADTDSTSTGKYLHSNQFAAGDAMLRIDSASEIENANPRLNNENSQVDWVDSDFNPAKSGKNYPKSPHVNHESNVLGFNSSNCDLPGVMSSTVPVRLGLVAWHVRRRYFVETSKTRTNGQTISKLNAFDTDGNIQPVESESKHQLDVLLNGKIDRNFAVVSSLAEMDLITWCVRRRYLVETAKKSSQGLPPNSYIKTGAPSQTTPRAAVVMNNAPRE